MYGIQNEILAVLRKIKDNMSEPATNKKLQLESHSAKHAETMIIFMLGALVPIIVSMVW